MKNMRNQKVTINKVKQYETSQKGEKIMNNNLGRKRDIEVQLPEGVCFGYCCGDCIYMDLNDINSYGDFYCGKKRKYYPGGDSICREFISKHIVIVGNTD